ncbi:MAG: hypothetical protein PUE02_08190 [Eggerthellaceae bacterium]|nr:hypothetical protein [Eggerthellaceae bacterium]
MRLFKKKEAPLSESEQLKAQLDAAQAAYDAALADLRERTAARDAAQARAKEAHERVGKANRTVQELTAKAHMMLDAAAETYADAESAAEENLDGAQARAVEAGLALDAARAAKREAQASAKAAKRQFDIACMAVPGAHKAFDDVAQTTVDAASAQRAADDKQRALDAAQAAFDAAEDARRDAQARIDALTARVETLTTDVEEAERASLVADASFEAADKAEYSSIGRRLQRIDRELHDATHERAALEDALNRAKRARVQADTARYASDSALDAARAAGRGVQEATMANVRARAAAEDARDAAEKAQKTFDKVVARIDKLHDEAAQLQQKRAQSLSDLQTLDQVAKQAAATVAAKRTALKVAGDKLKAATADMEPVAKAADAAGETYRETRRAHDEAREVLDDANDAHAVAKAAYDRLLNDFQDLERMREASLAAAAVRDAAAEALLAAQKDESAAQTAVEEARHALQVARDNAATMASVDAEASLEALAAADADGKALPHSAPAVADVNELLAQIGEEEGVARAAYADYTRLSAESNRLHEAYVESARKFDAVNATYLDAKLSYEQALTMDQAVAYRRTR